MKSPLPLIILNIIFSLFNKSYSQNRIESKNKIQFEYGISHAYNYHAPVIFFLCFEGCSTESQSGRITSNSGLNYYRSINARNEIEIGIGLSAFKSQEILKDAQSGNTFAEYIDYKLYNFSIGHRYKFNEGKSWRPYIENHLLYETYREKMIKIGYAVKSRLGLLYVHNNQINFNADIFFKSGITKYNGVFIPYYYGIETGMSFVF